MTTMKVLLVFLLIASTSHHPSKQHKPPQKVERLQLPPVKYIMPAWCAVPQIEQYRTGCMVYRI
jgi:hypothetical protein